MAYFVWSSDIHLCKQCLFLMDALPPDCMQACRSYEKGKDAMQYFVGRRIDGIEDVD